LAVKALATLFEAGIYPVDWLSILMNKDRGSFLRLRRRQALKRFGGSNGVTD